MFSRLLKSRRPVGSSCAPMEMLPWHAFGAGADVWKCGLASCIIIALSGTSTMMHISTLYNPVNLYNTSPGAVVHEHVHSLPPLILKPESNYFAQLCRHVYRHTQRPSDATINPESSPKWEFTILGVPLLGSSVQGYPTIWGFIFLSQSPQMLVGDEILLLCHGGPLSRVQQRNKVLFNASHGLRPRALNFLTAYCKIMHHKGLEHGFQP